MCEFVRERECACERVRVRASACKRECVCACAIGFKVRVLCEGKSFGIFSYKKRLRVCSAGGAQLSSWKPF